VPSRILTSSRSGQLSMYQLSHSTRAFRSCGTSSSEVLREGAEAGAAVVVLDPAERGVGRQVGPDRECRKTSAMTTKAASQKTEPS
jgi:hypothetical protein